MKIKPEQIPDLVFQVCPSFKEAWPSIDLGKLSGQRHSIPILAGLAKHVARLWNDHRFEDFPVIFNLIERLHVEGNKKAVDHVVFYFTETLYIELRRLGINPRFAERRLGPNSSYWLHFIKAMLGWN
jgi:hypothetical protein